MEHLNPSYIQATTLQKVGFSEPKRTRKFPINRHASVKCCVYVTILLALTPCYFSLLEIEKIEAVRAKERMEAGRPKEGKAKMPEDNGQARDKAAVAVGVRARYVSPHNDTQPHALQRHISRILFWFFSLRKRNRICRRTNAKIAPANYSVTAMPPRR